MFKQRLKQALCLLVTFMLVLGDVPAQANDLTAAFNSLLNNGGANPAVAFNQGGYYSSEARGAFIGGGMDVRFPQRTMPTLVNVVPFQFSAGCGGISLAFGGFSFINGTQIENLIKSVAQDSIGMAVQLVMTTLCGPCASVMSIMRSLAMEASNSSIDSCQIAHNLLAKTGLMSMHSFGGSLPSEFNSAAQSICGMFSSINGFASDYSGASSSSDCSDVSKSVDNIENMVSEVGSTMGLSSSQKHGAVCDLGGPCNITWHVFNHNALNDLPFADAERLKLLFANLMGMSVIMAGSTGTSGTSPTSTTSTGTTTSSASDGSTITASDAINPTYTVTPGPHSFAPTLGNLAYSGGNGVDIHKVYQLFLCGTTEPAGLTAQAMAVYSWACPQAATAGNASASVSLGMTPVWVCGPPPDGVSTSSEGNYQNCDYPEAARLDQSPLAGTGFLPLVANLLAQGVQDVIDNKPLTDTPGLIPLINSVPVPIYQAINISAVYPDAGSNLISVMSVEVAELMTYAYIEQIAREAATMQSTVHIPPRQLYHVFKMLGAIRAGTIDSEHSMLMQMTLQQQMMNQIRMLNVAMQRQVLPPQLLTENAYSSQLSNAAVGAAQ